MSSKIFTHYLNNDKFDDIKNIKNIRRDWRIINIYQKFDYGKTPMSLTETRSNKTGC